MSASPQIVLAVNGERVVVPGGVSPNISLADFIRTQTRFKVIPPKQILTVLFVWGEPWSQTQSSALFRCGADLEHTINVGSAISMAVSLCVGT